MKHSKTKRKRITAIVCLLLILLSAVPVCYAVTNTVTTDCECSKLFCSEKLICVGPIESGNMIPSSVPYIGGTTLRNSTILEDEYNDTIAANQKDWDDVMAEEHIYIVYCPSFSGSSLVDHTMVVFFISHLIDYDADIYIPSYGGTTHSLCYPCIGSTVNSKYDKTINLGKSLSSDNEDAIYQKYVKNQNVACGYSFFSSNLPHRWVYSESTSISSTQHQFTKTCSLCKYSEVVTENHELSASSWTSINDNQHSRVKTCDDCGYSVTETVAHSFVFGPWQEYDDNQHRRTKTCSDCGYSVFEYLYHYDADEDLVCDDCDYNMVVFSVTVPTSMNVSMDKNGNIYTADNIKIYNNSTDGVEVKSISLTAKNGWTVVPYSTNMANEKVDCKKVGLKIRNATSTGSEMNMTGDWNIPKGNSMDLTYDAVISATTNAVSDTQILEITYVIDWSDA